MGSVKYAFPGSKLPPKSIFDQISLNERYIVKTPQYKKVFKIKFPMDGMII